MRLSIHICILAFGIWGFHGEDVGAVGLVPMVIRNWTDPLLSSVEVGERSMSAPLSQTWDEREPIPITSDAESILD